MDCKDIIRRKALECGAFRCGFALAECVDPSAQALYADWIGQGWHADMAFCERYLSERSHPASLLPGVRTVICCAFNYYHPSPLPPMAGAIARYAWGSDYHYVLKQRLRLLADFIVANYGGECRAAVDSAPIRERYWAQRAGVGFVGLNNQLILPGAGSYFFLGELLWTGEVPADEPCAESCGRCGRCVAACPGRALDGRGACDARKCMSYLTIEHRGELPQDTELHGCVYGCDVCQRVCPHNARPPVSQIREFECTDVIMSFTPQSIRALTPSRYRSIMRQSAMSRVPLRQILRNLSAD